jgi:hypothetical protein
MAAAELSWSQNRWGQRRHGLTVALAVPLLLALSACGYAGRPAAATSQPLQSDHEVAQARFQCLKDRGWDVSLQKGAIYAEIPAAQQAQYDSDAQECLKQAGIDPNVAISDDQLREIFTTYTRVEKCLRHEGWSTPRRPSFDSFLATYESAPWIPWSEVPADDMADAGNKCPEMMGDSR